MKRFLSLWAGLVALAGVAPILVAIAATAPDSRAQTAADAPRPVDGPSELDKAAVAAVVTDSTGARSATRPPDLLEHLVDVVLELFNVRSSGNTVTHYVISALFLASALLLRRIVTGIIFSGLKRLAAKTETTLDDKLFPVLETPVATLVMVTGIFAALKVLKLSSDSDRYIGYGSTVAFSLVIFWGLSRAFDAVLEHAHEIARNKQMGIAAFMPWIRKSLVTMFVVLGLMLTIQALGFDVKALLAGLGIGGLAFALAAQDTLANLFGSIVVAVDQPFKIGESVRIGQNVGSVEDIGLRSTRIRLVDKSLMTIPNKTVASETITNLSRFTRRRFEQVIGLNYGTTPEQMEAIVAQLRGILASQPEVDPASVMTYFRDFSASSLDLWIVYEIPDADLKNAMQVKQRINLLIMREIATRGLAFAFPTQTIEFAGSVAEKLSDRGSKPAPPRVG